MLANLARQPRDAQRSRYPVRRRGVLRLAIAPARQDRARTSWNAPLKAFALVPLQTVVAGRTDTGVAWPGAGWSISTPTSDRSDFLPWVRGTNAFLPSTVAVQWAKPMPGQLPRALRPPVRGAPITTRSTCIRLRSPMLASRAGWVPHTPARYRGDARGPRGHLIGEHDFSSFRSSECQSKTPVKLLYTDRYPRLGQLHPLPVPRQRPSCLPHGAQPDGLPDRGGDASPLSGRLDGRRCLAARNRERAAPTFAPDGLYLAHVRLS